MSRSLRVLAWAASFAIPAAAAFYAGYVVTGGFFREQAVPLPFDRFGLVVGAAAAFFALGAACLVRTLFRVLANQRS